MNTTPASAASAADLGTPGSFDNAHGLAPRTPKNPGDDMLTVAEACRFLRVAEGTLRYWRHLGCGPHSFKIGRHVRYWRADLILWLSEQTNNPQNHR